MRFAKCPDFFDSWGRITSPGSAQPQAWPSCAQEVLEHCLQAHRSRLVRDYVDTEGGDIQLEFLPPYAPELNPVEYLWAHWKQHEMPNFCPKDFAELCAFARAKLKRTQRRKLLVAAFWKQADLPF